MSVEMKNVSELSTEPTREELLAMIAEMGETKPHNPAETGESGTVQASDLETDEPAQVTDIEVIDMSDWVLSSITTRDGSDGLVGMQQESSQIYSIAETYAGLRPLFLAGVLKNGHTEKTTTTYAWKPKKVRGEGVFAIVDGKKVYATEVATPDADDGYDFG